MMKKFAGRESRRLTIGLGLATAVVGIAGISLGWAAAQEQSISNAPANEQPITRPRAETPTQPIPGMRNPFDDDASRRAPPQSPSITSPAPLQGPDGAAPRGGRAQAPPEGNARESTIRERPAPSGAQQGRMPGLNPFETGPEKTDQNGSTERSTTDSGESSGTYSAAEQNVRTGIDLLKAGKYEEALKSFEEGQKADPKEPTSYFYEGIVYRQLSRYDDAIDAFTIAASLTTDDLEALAETYLRRGIVWFYKGEYGIAWGDFDEAAFNCADTDPRPELWKGLAKAKQGRWLEAVNSFAASLAHNDHYAPAYVNRGLAYLALNEPKKALDDFEQAIRQEPHNAASYAKRAMALQRLGKNSEAADSYRQAARLDPSNAHAYRNMPTVKAGNNPQAGQDQTKTNKLDTNIDKRSKTAG
jgi:tetratricopeptide (TPR) repeat protein